MYYISSIIEVADGQVMLKTARKYEVTSGKMTFVWPSLDDIIEVGKLTAENADASINRSQRNILNLQSESFRKSCSQ